MNTIKLITIALCFGFSIVTNGQTILDVDQYKFECLDDIVMVEKFENLPVYTGDDSAIDVELVTVVISKASTIWEKKKADRNCLSADPNDCLVWCLVDVPGRVEKYTILNDTTSTDEWEMKPMQKYKEGQVVKVSVMCSEEISEELVEEIKNKLIAVDYDLNPKKNYKKLNRKMRRVINAFQRDYDLGEGLLTRETMEELAKM